MEDEMIHFCKECYNMTYIHLNEKDELIHVCKICSKTEKLKEKSNCVYSTDYEIFDVSSIINSNKYINHDITLPTIQNNPNLKCPNVDCPKDKETSLKYIKYDEDNMKYIYICNNCGQKWNS